MKTGSLARHFEGWQPGLLAIVIAGSSALIAVPRAVVPQDLPEPTISPGALTRVAERDAELAAAAEREPPELDVRALGQAIRDYGRADASGIDSRLIVERRHVFEASRRAQTYGIPALLRLRAFQLRAFQREIRLWQQTGEETPELVELSGNFIRTARQSGWIRGDKLLLDRTMLATLFKKRWTDLAQIQGALVDPSLDEQRAFYRFILLNPPSDGPLPPETARDQSPDIRAFLSAQQYRLKKVDELAKIDPAYPAELARGVLNYRLHRYHLAVESFRRWLDQHPEGPYTLRAQNYLAGALERALDDR